MKPQHMATKKWTKLLNKSSEISISQGSEEQYRKWSLNTISV